MTDLVILGAGGHGRETLDIVEVLNAVEPTWNFLGFIDDGAGIEERLQRRGVRILGPTSHMETLDASYVIGIGSSELRRELDNKLTAWGRPAVALVHPTSCLGSDIELGPGCIVAAGSHLTTNVRIGRHTHVNVGAVISHDCRIGEYTSLSPGVYLNGEVTIGSGVFLGTGAIVTPGITVGDGAVVGAGAVLVDDVEPGATVVGVPGRNV